MSEKKEIIFNTSMTADKRNNNFAYLRKNVFDSQAKGLYPSVDFTPEYPDDLLDTDNIVDILGSRESAGGGSFYDIKVIYERGNDIRFANLGSNGLSNTALTNMNYECGAFGNDGVHICVDNDKLYRVNHTNSNTSSIGVTTGAFPDIAGFDGLYYWWLSQNEIYKQIDGNAPTLAFNNIGVVPRFVDFLNDQMIIFYEIAGGVGVLFWDKSDMDLFDKRIFIPNCKLIAGGVVNGRLMVVTGVGNSSNTKEKNGEIVVSAFDGEKFVQLNSIKAGQRDAQYVRETGVGIGANVMVFSIDDNTSDAQPDLFQNYIYKIKSDGSIEASWLPNEDEDGPAIVVRVFYNFILYATGELPRIYTNEAFGTDYDYYRDYIGETVYITNFLQEAYNRHKLEGVAIAFEKLFENEDNPPTIPFGATLSISSLLYNSLTLSWPSADDDWQTDDELLYRVYMSTSNNITTEADMIANGSLIQDWTAGITSKNVTGLAELTTYYFNVIVKDGGNQTAVYTPVSATTPEYTLVTDWHSPQQNGAYFVPAEGGLIQEWSNAGNVVNSDDSAATANQGQQAYKTKWFDFGFAIPAGATILGIETRMEAKYTANPTSSSSLKISASIYKNAPVDGVTPGVQFGVGSRSHPQSGGLTASDVVYTRGGYGDLWNSTWTPAEINASGFGFALAGQTSSSPSTTNYAVDQFQCRIIYKP